MHYQSYTFSSGLRLIHYPTTAPVAYCGFAVNAGTRDELPEQYGMAHFVEHVLFKGTKKRTSGHIINRMENVGGELNAYTTKEETVIYSVFLEEHFERALELISDLVFNSQFPENELDKERDVILDEINSYKDNPSELIFDEFENLLFEGHDMGHHILGEEKTLSLMTQVDLIQFHKQYYQPGNMVFFSMGKTPFQKIIRLAEKYIGNVSNEQQAQLNRILPIRTLGKVCMEDKELYQRHVMIGAKSYGMFEERRTALFLLNNILGGPGMNSRLNLSLREKSGLVYNIESNLTTYTDTGVFSIYFGCDPKSLDKCIKLVNRELKKLREVKLSDYQLAVFKKQLKGQMGIAHENSENIALSMGKSFLHRNKYDSLSDAYQKIDNLSASLLMDVANEIFAEENLYRLVF